MYIQRVLLLVAILLAIFAPALELWVFASPSTWHRPFLVWLLIIVVILASQRSSENPISTRNRRKPTSSDTSDSREHPLRRASDSSNKAYADKESDHAI